MIKQLRFLSGIQRSGSTLLTKLLNQHPEVFASNTSPLFDYLFTVVERLTELQQTSSAAQYINIPHMLGASVDAFYHFTPKPVIVDKHRAWATNYANIHQQLIADPRIIVTMRPVEEVITSFHTILQKNNTPATIAVVYRDFLEEHITTLIESAAHTSKFLTVTYEELTTDTASALRKVENFIGLDHHSYTLDHVVDNDPENDMRWGIQNLHTVRPTISVESIAPSEIMTAAELRFFQKKTERLYRAFGLHT